MRREFIEQRKVRDGLSPFLRPLLLVGSVASATALLAYGLSGGSYDPSAVPTEPSTQDELAPDYRSKEEVLATAKREAEDLAQRQEAVAGSAPSPSDTLPFGADPGPSVAELLRSDGGAAAWKPVPVQQLLAENSAPESSPAEDVARARELRRGHGERLLQRELAADETHRFNQVIRIDSLEGEPHSDPSSARASDEGEGDDQDGLSGLRSLSDALLRKSATQAEQSPGNAGLDDLGAIAGAVLGRGDAASGGELQRREDQREDFWQHGGDSLQPALLLATVTKPVSQYVLRMGTVIPGVLITGINSESPGQILGEVSRNVYDSVNQLHLLVPSGSQLVGTYSARVAHGQERAQISWVRVNFPNGQTLDLGGMSGSDPTGQAGFHDRVDRHLWRQIGAALLGASVTVGYEVTAPRSPLGMEGAIHRGVGEQLLQLSQNMQQRWAQLPPTLSIRSGYRFLVVLSKDVVFPSAYADENRHGRMLRRRQARMASSGDGR